MPRREWAPERRDVIWIDCNPQDGLEMKDVHPLLVLSPRDFNARTGIVIGLPMTTAAHNRMPAAERLQRARGLRSSLGPGRFKPRDIDALKRRGRA
jgi:mRNA interferase MazF